MSLQRTKHGRKRPGRGGGAKKRPARLRKGLATLWKKIWILKNGLFNLVDEDGNSAFELLGSVEIDDETYALVPAEKRGRRVWLLKVTTDEDGSELLVTIDDDDEFDRAVAAFEEEFECEIDLDDDEDEADDRSRVTRGKSNAFCRKLVSTVSIRHILTVCSFCLVLAALC